MSNHDNFEKCCDNCKYYKWYWDKCKKFDCEMDARSCCSCHEKEKLYMNTFESKSKKEIQDFLEEKNPEAWYIETRRDLETFQIIYVIRWM